jgi:hypothetical protein
MAQSLTVVLSHLPPRAHNAEDEACGTPTGTVIVLVHCHGRSSTLSTSTTAWRDGRK